MNFERLFTLRLIVARYGEMDMAKWWNTKGQLGRFGSMALSRGFTRTHHFAQARSVFAVASSRCNEVFHHPDCVTLWSLPDHIEEEFDLRWEKWLDNSDGWKETFAKIESMASGDLISCMKSFGVIGERDFATVTKLPHTTDSNSVLLPDPFLEKDEDLTMLALAFSKGSEGSLVIPYAKCR